MMRAFADTFYFLALMSRRDARHREAVQYSRDPHLHLVTTEWVLTEYADACCSPFARSDFLSMYRLLKNHQRVKIIPADTLLFQRGVEFYEKRPDKEWSLTDYISFVVMHDERIAQALTGDKHFEQAGFTALLK